MGESAALDGMMHAKAASIMAAKIMALGYAEVALSGRCMEPLLVAGDKARVEVCTDPMVGDLCLVALSDGILALHRVVSVNGMAVTCKGDYSGKAEVIRAECVIGRATAFMLDGVGRWVRWHQDDAFRFEVVSLSRVLSDREATHAMRQEARQRIWALNEGKRAELLHVSLAECAVDL